MLDRPPIPLFRPAGFSSSAPTLLPYWVPSPGPYLTPSVGTRNTPSMGTHGHPDVTYQHRKHTQSSPNINIRSQRDAQNGSHGPFPLCILTCRFKVSNYPPPFRSLPYLSLTSPYLSYCISPSHYCYAPQTRILGATFRLVRVLGSYQGGVVTIPVGRQGVSLPTNHSFYRASASPISVIP